MEFHSADFDTLQEEYSLYKSKQVETENNIGIQYLIQQLEVQKEELLPFINQPCYSNHLVIPVKSTTNDLIDLIDARIEDLKESLEN